MSLGNNSALSQTHTSSSTPTKSEVLKDINFIQISWPIIIEHFLYLSILFADAIILSRISTDAAAAVGGCAFVISFGLIVVIGFGQGASICISHKLGGFQKIQAQEIARASFIIIILLGLILGFIQFTLREQIPTWMGFTGEVQKNATIFLSIVGGTIFLQAIMSAIGFIMRTYGYSKKPMFSALIVSVLNIFFACSVVYGLFGFPKMGVLGVALSTLFARLIGSFLMLYFAYRKIRFILEFENTFTILKLYTKKIISYGIPICLEPISYHGSQLLITRIIALLGAEALALRTYIWSIISFNTLFVFGFAQATQIAVSRLYGAKLFEDAQFEFYKNLKISLFGTFAIVTVTWYFGQYILSVFTSDPHTISVGSSLLAMSYLLEPGRTTNNVAVSGLRAVGETKFPLYTGLVFMWGLSLPIAWVFGIYLGYGLPGVWLGLACDEVIRAIINFFHFHHGKWKRKAILEIPISPQASHVEANPV